MLNSLFGIILFSSISLQSNEPIKAIKIPQKLEVHDQQDFLRDYGFSDKKPIKDSLFFLIGSTDGGKSVLRLALDKDLHPYAHKTNGLAINLTFFSTSITGENSRESYLLHALNAWIEQENPSFPFTIKINSNKPAIAKVLNDLGFVKSTVFMDNNSLHTPSSLPSKTNIRSAGVLDYFAVVALFLKTSAWHQRLQKDVYWGDRYPKYKRYLQILRAMVVGDVILISEETESANSFCWGKILENGAEIEELYVDDDSRGIGIGRQLLRKFELLAYQQGAKKVFFEVGGENHRAISFYKREGYVVKSESYYRPIN